MSEINKRTIANVGGIKIGLNNKIVIQSMANIKTSNFKSVINQINQLVSYGCELVRVSLLDDSDFIGLKEIIKQANCPIIADIQYNPEYAIKSIKCGVAGIRINPGNFLNIDKFVEIINQCKKYHVAMRIGINTGSLPNHIKTNMQIINYIKKYITICEKNKFTNIVLSIKSSNSSQTISLNKKLYSTFKYPIHIGVTEAGDLLTSTVRSSKVLSQLLSQKIGNTIRVSISGDPINEVKVANLILQENGYDVKLTKLISCPTCGRCTIDHNELLNKINDFIYQYPNNKISVAIMGCNVNGIKEVKNATIGIYGVNNKYVLCCKHKMIGMYNFDEVLKLFKKYYLELFVK